MYNSHSCLGEKDVEYLSSVDFNKNKQIIIYYVINLYALN